MNEYKVPYIFDKIKKEYRNRDAVLSVNVPGSKSITNRALLIAALAEGSTELNGILFSDDSRVFIDCLKSLGISVTVNEITKSALISGTGGSLPDTGEIYVGSAGTAARFITATLGLSQGDYIINSSQQMKKRPMDALIDALRSEGAEFEFMEEPGHFPFRMRGNGFSGKPIEVDIDKSSQFLSALLLNSVMSQNDVDIRVLGSHGLSYIDMTVNMMRRFGVEVTKEMTDTPSGSPDAGYDSGLIYHIPSGQNYTGRIYDIEPDMSAAAYFYAMSPLLGISVCVSGTSFDSLQGDVAFIRLLEKMGCEARNSSTGIVLDPPRCGSFSGIDVDMSAFSDQAITLCAIAPFADSPTRISGIGHIRLQESDRMSAIVNELKKAGIKTEHDSDSITVYPGTPNACHISTYEDHRMAMGFSLMGLRCPGIIIDNPLCCRKTFDNFFEVLDSAAKELVI